MLQTYGFCIPGQMKIMTWTVTYQFYRSSKTMSANRISYWIDGKGPSYSFDNGCAGSMTALEMAYNRMKCGEIDCAIVGGSNYCFIPELTLNMKR